MLQLIINNVIMNINPVIFSDGAKSFKVKNLPEVSTHVVISVDNSTPVSEIQEEVILLTSCLYEADVFKNGNVQHFILNIPYLPYGRADRVFENGNPNPLHLFLTWLEAIKFTKVYIQDPHNPEFLSRYNINFEITSQEELAYNAIKDKHKVTCVVAPDKGAVEKASRLCNKLEVPLFTANKIRNLSTGRILSIEFNETPRRGSTVYIVDDILDGGGTFIPLANKLKELDCTVILYVTHLIASKGLRIFSDSIDKIYYTNIINDYVTPTHVINFNNGNYFKQV